MKKAALCSLKFKSKGKIGLVVLARTLSVLSCRINMVSK